MKGTALDIEQKRAIIDALYEDGDLRKWFEDNIYGNWVLSQEQSDAYFCVDLIIDGNVCDCFTLSLAKKILSKEELK